MIGRNVTHLRTNTHIDSDSLKIDDSFVFFSNRKMMSIYFIAEKKTTKSKREHTNHKLRISPSHEHSCIFFPLRTHTLSSLIANKQHAFDENE